MMFASLLSAGQEEMYLPRFSEEKCVAFETVKNTLLKQQKNLI